MTRRRKQGDRWLICSDGLYGMVPKADLPALLSTEDIEEAADRLLEAALEGGGQDNISLVILQDDAETPAEEKAESEEEKETEAPAEGEAPEEVTPQ